MRLAEEERLLLKTKGFNVSIFRNLQHKLFRLSFTLCDQSVDNVEQGLKS